MIVDPTCPKLTLFAFENDTLVCVGTFGTVYEAVIWLEPLIPKLMPLLLANEIVPLVPLCVPAASAAISWFAGIIADAVNVPLLRPNETLLLLTKKTVPLVAVCVPAARLIAGCTVCAGNDAEAVSVEPFVPNVMLFEFEKTSELAV